jgi:lipoprotein-anchoring transpeptidase ErfK/SrfK
MKTIAALFTAAALLVGSVSASEANFSLFGSFGSLQTSPTIVAKVSLAEQKMFLSVTDTTGLTRTFEWKVSTGKPGYDTPTGAWNPTWLSRNHRSKTYDDAPMPYAVFFTGGYAVHATDAVGRLGKPASHGCVRLAPENAATFFRLVSAYGKQNVQIVITD